MPDRDGRFAGKVAFITGGARGQGRSHALAFAREGADVVVTDIAEPVPAAAPYETASQADLDETVRLVQETGARCLGIKADACDAAAMRAAVADTIDHLGRIDVLAVNHGTCVNRTWDEMTDEQFDLQVETNLSGAWRSTRPVIPHMVAQGGGAIVFTASTAALAPYAAATGYCASKAGMLGLMRALACELAPHSIRVNAILPTNVATPMLHNQAAADMFAGRPGGTIEDMRFPAQAMLLLPIPWLESQDISNALLYLTSDEARYVTGVALPVDGGTLTQPPGIPPIVAERLGSLEAGLGA